MLPILYNSITNSFPATINELKLLLFNDEWDSDNYLCAGNTEAHEELREQINLDKEFVNIEARLNRMNIYDDTIAADGYMSESESAHNNNGEEEEPEEEEEEEEGEEANNIIIDDATVNEYKDFHCCNNYCIRSIANIDIKNLIRSTANASSAMKNATLYGMVSAAQRNDDDNSEATKRKRRREQVATNLTAGEEIETRQTYYYFVSGQNVCGKAYSKLFKVSQSSLDRIQTKLKSGHYICTESKSGKHRIGQTSDCTQEAKEFMDYLIHEEAYPNPSSRGGKDGIPIVHLSSKFTKLSVYNDYYVPYINNNSFQLSYKSFAKLWKQRFSHVKIFNPKYDLCNTCCDIEKFPDAEIMLQHHLKDANLQRTTFNDNVKFTRRLENIGTNVQLSFDYAEKVLIPKFADQQQSLYFQTPLKMDLFGIANNTSGVQTNYVLPEGHWPPEKGINPIASNLFHNLKKYHDDKSTIYFMADNCSGQNKNYFMLWYLCYLVILFSNCDNIYLKFLIAGHTKNFCDAAFGLCKRAIKRKDILTPKHLIAAYEESSTCNIVETVDNITFYNWKEFLGQFFDKKLKGINAHHEFKFQKNQPGRVYFKELDNNDEWESKDLFKPGITVEDLLFPQNNNYKVLSDFIIPAEDYKLENKKGTAKLNRKQYLDKDIVNKYFKGTHTIYREEFYQCK